MPPTLIEPLADRVLVLPDARSDRTASGFWLPAVARTPARSGLVLAVGPGARDDADGRRIPVDARPGDRVAFGPYAGVWFTRDGVDYRLLMEKEVLARTTRGGNDQEEPI